MRLPNILQDNTEVFDKFLDEALKPENYHRTDVMEGVTRAAKYIEAEATRARLNHEHTNNATALLCAVARITTLRLDKANARIDSLEEALVDARANNHGLERDSRELHALHAAGVDTWEGYDGALSDLNDEG